MRILSEQRFLSKVAHLILFALLLSAAGCSVPQFAIAEEAPLVCSPKVVTKDDVLTLNFGHPHEQYLGVFAPDHRYYFLVAGEEQHILPQEPLLPVEMFREKKELSGKVSEFKGYEYINPPTFKADTIFKKPGIYKFIIGDNLESDSHASRSCEVTFR